MRQPILATACAALALTVFGGAASAAATVDPRPQSTAFYVYDLLDPAAPASWDNSGSQTLIQVTDGFADAATVNAVIASQECGRAVQVDFVYLTPGDIPSTVTPPTLAFQGVLRDAQHHSTATCAIVPAQPADIVTGSSSDTLDCEGRIYTVSQTETRITHLYDEASNTWVAQEPVTVEVGRDTRPATEQECPTAVEQPKGVDAELTVAAPAPAPAPRVLAETGPVDGWLAIPAAGALFFGILFAAAGRIRRSLA